MKPSTTKKSPPYSAYRSALQQRYFSIRWLLFGWLFRTHVLPQSKLSLDTVPVLKHLPLVTYGDLLLSTPLMALLWKGIVCCFINENIEQSGHIAYYCLVSTFLLANKSSSILSLLFGISWERLVPYHYCASLLALFLSISHCYVAFTFGSDLSVPDGRELKKRGRGSGGCRRSSGFDNPIGMLVDVESMEASSQHSLIGEDPSLWKYFWDGPVNMAGTVMTICIISLVAMSATRLLRKSFFRLWLVLHILLSVTVVSFSLVHAPSTTKLIFIWWVFDGFVRNIIQAKFFYAKRASLTKLLPNLVEIRFPRRVAFQYRAGQFVRIAVKELNAFEYHPVTISSAPVQDEVTIHFRALGDWTNRLMELADTHSEIHVAIQGPFGGLVMNLDDHLRYPRVLLVCGGIGVTPMMSLARQLLYAHEKLGQTRESIHIVWAVQDLSITNVLPILTKSTRPILKDEDASDYVYPSEFTADTDTGSEQDHEAQVLPVFKGDIYVTRDSDTVPSWKDDCFTIHNGCRPDVSAILREYTSTDGNVAVLACGPAALVESTKFACHKRSGPCVNFEFHEEVFEY